MTGNRNRPHTVIAVAEADIVAAIAGMISTLGTRPGNSGNNCLKFDSHGRNRYTAVWRMTDRTFGFVVSFRKGSDGPDRAYYRTASDAAEAIHEGKHTPAALTKDEI